MRIPSKTNIKKVDRLDKCKVNGCAKRYYAKNYCRNHYYQVHNTGNVRFIQKVGTTRCLICDEKVFGKGLCVNHYRQLRFRNDLNFKLAIKYRQKVNNFLASTKTKSEDTVIEILGIGIKEFRLHLESSFHDRSTGEKMSWENHSRHGWHIDHIIPVCLFDLTDPEEIKRAFHYSNTQALWSEENFRKSYR